jgi:site-specific recombinase XerD
MFDKTLTVSTPGQVVRGDIDIAFSDFLRLRVADGDASPHTVRAYRGHVRAFYSFCLENGLQPAQATEGDLEAYRRQLIDSRYTRKTIGAKLQAVERFFAAAVWRGLRSDNPAQSLKAPRDRTDKAERVKFLPLAGFRRLLLLPEATTPIGARDRAMLLLMGMHGLRIAEVAGLEVGDLDLASEPCKVTVRGKGGKERAPYLTPKTAAALRSWLELRPAVGASALFVALDRRTYGQPLSIRNLRRRVDGYLRRAGLKAQGVSAHSLRHSFATWATFAGADLPAVSAALGHASVATTGVYAKVADKIRQNPATYLEKLLDVSD